MDALRAETNAAYEVEKQGKVDQFFRDVEVRLGAIATAPRSISDDSRALTTAAMSRSVLGSSHRRTRSSCATRLRASLRSMMPAWMPRAARGLATCGASWSSLRMRRPSGTGGRRRTSRESNRFKAQQVYTLSVVSGRRHERKRAGNAVPESREAERGWMASGTARGGQRQSAARQRRGKGQAGRKAAKKEGERASKATGATSQKVGNPAPCPLEITANQTHSSLLLLHTVQTPHTDSITPGHARAPPRHIRHPASSPPEIPSHPRRCCCCCCS